MEEESITDAKNVTADKFRHVSSAQRENENTIFTIKKLDISDKLVDAVKNLKINDTEYYESKTMTTSDVQSNLPQNM